MIDRVAGRAKAAPRPWTPRMTMSIVELSASAAPPAPAQKIVIPAARGFAPAKAVADAAGDEEGAGEDQGVEVYDPLQHGVRGGEVAGDGGEGGVDDGAVEEDEKGGEGHYGEDESLFDRRALAGGCFNRWGG